MEKQEFLNVMENTLVEVFRNYNELRVSDEFDSVALKVLTMLNDLYKTDYDLSFKVSFGMLKNVEYRLSMLNEEN